MASLSPLSKAPFVARLLGLLGLLPFLLGGLGVWLPLLGDLRFALPIMVLAYAALIASFLGGVRWGAAMQASSQSSSGANSGTQARHFVLSIVPSLIALVAFLLPLPQAFTLLIIMFLAQAVLDVMAAETGELADWYAPLRLALTSVAILSMASLIWHSLTH
jgi:hypothetical protein